MYKQLVSIDRTPLPYEYYTAESLWNDEHRAKQMLNWHLDPESEPASRNHKFIKKSVEWICSHLTVGDKTKIADFGCGPGLYTTHFARQGADVTGIDFSRNSILYARNQAEKQNLQINYINKNYLNFNFDEQFDIITMIYCDFCVLSDEQRAQLLRIFSRHLKDNGVLLLDVFSLEAFQRREEVSIFAHNLLDGFWSDKDYYGFLKTIKYEKEKIILDKYTIIEPEKEFEVYNWLKYYNKKTLTEEFSRNGFHITECYSDVAGQPFSDKSDTLAIIARKQRLPGQLR